MRILFLILILLMTSHAMALDFKENSDIKSAFEKAGAVGTFILYDAQEKSFTGHNGARGNIRYIPASTFKIANSLIGLKMGAVKNIDEILPYGGGPQYLKSWENDMSLRAAIKISNVPIYQELARRIGLKAMQENIIKLNYGNGNIGEAVDTFWLRGPLEISAFEQAEFLINLAQNKLPFSDMVQQQVRDITIIENMNGATLHAKTGLTSTPDPDIGWWVGWVEREGRIYSFALNIDVNEDADIAKRISLGKACLRILGLF